MGYYFQRPLVFEELRVLNKLISITPFSRITNEDFDLLYVNKADSTFDISPIAFEDPYYNGSDRGLMAISSRNRNQDCDDCFRWREIALDSTKILDQKRISEIEYLISNSNTMPVPVEPYKFTGRPFSGYVIEFEHDSVLYEYVYMRTHQFANDHFAHCEYLLKNNKIHKNQIFYTDFAGIEGFEYLTFFGIFEIGALILALIIYSLSKGSSFVLSKYKNKLP